MSISTQITCPDCQSPIYIESSLLVIGQSFKCSNKQCSTSISLAVSDLQKVTDAFTKFEEIRENAIDQARQVS